MEGGDAAEIATTLRQLRLDRLQVWGRVADSLGCSLLAGWGLDLVGWDWTAPHRAVGTRLRSAHPSAILALHCLATAG